MDSRTTHFLDPDHVDGIWEDAPKRRQKSFNYGSARPAIPQDSYTYDDYNVGWICALPIEMAAAKAMLDTIHDALPNTLHDSNAYILGSIGTDNIVIASLPSGHYGTTNAATVANNMRRTFPSITIGLMVGVGGGAPGRADVRLGDVVVSTRVIQHDFGKIAGEGGLERTGIINKPPQELLTAVSKLRADHESAPSQISAFLEEMIQRHPSMMRYTRAGRLKDHLFNPSYEHVDSSDTCENCDTSMLINRPARDSMSPRIHYGIVASGNQVMKHAQTRDRLTRELNILCFEMEAAGLMDSFPCLVVRGICDYSDSHKNKDWQEYAAAAAAAYAKELLSVTPSRDILDDVDVEKQLKRQRILWKALAFERIDAHRSHVKKNHSKTCEWLLRHEDYLSWLDPLQTEEHHGFLWIRGKPGTGKSTIMKYAYTESVKNKSVNTISFFFNARGDSLERSTVGMYRSLLFQLLEAKPTLLTILNTQEHKSDLEKVYTAFTQRSSSVVWPLELLQALLRTAVGNIGQRRLVMFVDALDECEDDQVEEMVEHFEELGEYATENAVPLRICFSSRHYPHIDIERGRKLTLELQSGHESDIHTYVRSKLKVGKSKLAEEIKNRIPEKANGIFMWVILVVQILNAEYKDGRIFDLRKRLDTIPSKLSDIFREILRRDNKSMEDFRLAVLWILFSKRPLSLEEFYFAMVSGLRAAELDAWDREEITSDDMGRYVLSSSRGLAETTQSDLPTVQFIHESVREFFLKDGIHELWPSIVRADFESMGHDQLARCCVSCYELDIECDDDSVSRLHPFLEYAVGNVLYHVDRAALKVSQNGFLERFRITTWIKLNNMLMPSKSYTSSADLLYIFADRNLPTLIKTILDRNPQIDLKGEKYGYPLFAALANGFDGAVKALLCRGLSRDRDCGFLDRLEYRRADLIRNQTPLAWAAARGHEEVVEILLATRGVDRTPGRLGRTPMSWAAGNGHIGVMERLLEPEGMESVPDHQGRSPLWWAVMNRHETIVQMLLERPSVDVNCRDDKGKTPLCLAATIGHVAILRLLMRKAMIEVDSADEGHRTPLWWAAMNGHEEVVRILLATGAVNVNAKDSKSRTALWWAAVNGHIGTVKALIAADGVDLDARDIKGATPLWWAVSNGFDAIAKALLATERVSHDMKDYNALKPSSRERSMRPRYLVDLMKTLDEAHEPVFLEDGGRESMGATNP